MNPSKPSFFEAHPIRIVLIDVHALSRSSSSALLDALPGMQVVAQTGEHEEALSMVARLQPDLVIIGMRVKGSSGPEAARQITRAHPKVRILFMTLFDDPEYIKSALDSGAHGYVLKQEPVAELLKAIEGVMRGGDVYLSPALKLKA